MGTRVRLRDAENPLDPALRIKSPRAQVYKMIASSVVRNPTNEYVTKRFAALTKA